MKRYRFILILGIILILIDSGSLYSGKNIENDIETDVNLYCTNNYESRDPTTLYVDDDFDDTVSGWGEIRFDKIRDALSYAINGDTIFVYNGIYKESIIIRQKELTLTGENKNLTIIDGDYTESKIIVVDKSANDVIIHNFTIRNSLDLFENDGGIIVGGKETTIEECVIKNNREGIIIDEIDCTIYNCIISDNNRSGIRIKDQNRYVSYFIYISKCDIYNNSYCGINLEEDSSDIFIIECNIFNNYYFGIELKEYCSNINIIDCKIFNHYYGIEFDELCFNNNISLCSIFNNSYGIIYFGAMINNNIYNCQIHNNTYDGLHFSYYSDIPINSGINNIFDCDIKDNLGNGIYFEGPYYSSKIFLCNISFNQLNGIYIGKPYYTQNIPYYFIDNSIYENDFHCNNEYNIFIEQSIYNEKIIMNYFYDNNFFCSEIEKNAIDNGLDYWNVSSGGNYWSDYIERYGDDGPKEIINDIEYWIRPYVLDGRYLIKNKDWKPLVNPRGPPPERLNPPIVNLVHPKIKEFYQGVINISWLLYDYDTELDNISITINFTDDTSEWSEWETLVIFNKSTKCNSLNLHNSKILYYNWDTRAFDNGIYKILISATDSDGLSDHEITPYLIINNEGPHIMSVNLLDEQNNQKTWIRNEQTLKIEAYVNREDIELYANLSKIISFNNGVNTNKVKPDSFENNTATWIINDIFYDGSGKLPIIITAIDSKSDICSKNLNFVSVDNNPPKIEIIKPKTGTYIYNKKCTHGVIQSYFFNNLFNTTEKFNYSLVIGAITIQAIYHDNYSGIQKIECRVNNKVINFHDKQFGWHFSDLYLTPNQLSIKVRVVDIAGNVNSKEVRMVKFL